MGRATDAVVTLWDDSAWPLNTQYELLLIFITVLYVFHNPNLVCREKQVAHLQRKMSKKKTCQKTITGKKDIFRAASTNLFQVSVNGLNDNVAAFERNRMWHMTMSAQSYWFYCFVNSFHKRVGENKHINKHI